MLWPDATDRLMPTLQGDRREVGRGSKDRRGGDRRRGRDRRHGGQRALRALPGESGCCFSCGTPTFCPTTISPIASSPRRSARRGRWCPRRSPTFSDVRSTTRSDRVTGTVGQRGPGTCPHTDIRLTVDGSPRVAPTGLTAEQIFAEAGIDAIVVRVNEDELRDSRLGRRRRHRVRAAHAPEDSRSCITRVHTCWRRQCRSSFPPPDWASARNGYYDDVETPFSGVANASTCGCGPSSPRVRASPAGSLPTARPADLMVAQCSPCLWLVQFSPPFLFAIATFVAPQPVQVASPLPGLSLCPRPQARVQHLSLCLNVVVAF